MLEVKDALQLSRQFYVLVFGPCVEELTVEARVLGHDLGELFHDLELALAALDRFLEVVEVHALALVLCVGLAAREGSLLARLFLGHVGDALRMGAAGLLEVSRREPLLDLPQRRLLQRLHVALDVRRAFVAFLQLPRDEALVREGRELGRDEGRVVDGETPATRCHCIRMEWKTDATR